MHTFVCELEAEMFREGRHDPFCLVNEIFKRAERLSFNASDTHWELRLNRI